MLGWELLWRWAFGIPAAALLYYQGVRMVAGVASGLSGLSASDPMQAGQQLALAAAVVKPEVERVALWLGPLLAVVWAIASGLGRSAVLKRLDPTLRVAPFTLILLQLLRMAALIAAWRGLVPRHPLGRECEPEFRHRPTWWLGARGSSASR